MFQSVTQTSQAQISQQPNNNAVAAPQNNEDITPESLLKVIS